MPEHLDFQINSFYWKKLRYCAQTAEDRRFFATVPLLFPERTYGKLICFVFLITPMTISILYGIISQELHKT